MQKIFEQFLTFKCHDEHPAVQRGIQEGLGFAEGISPISLIHSHTGKCHVCPSCEEQLHSDLAPLSEPPHHGCATCQDWLSSQPQKPRSYSVPSIGDGDSQSPAGSRYRPNRGARQGERGRKHLYVDKVSLAGGIRVVPALAGARV